MKEIFDFSDYFYDILEETKQVSRMMSFKNNRLEPMEDQPIPGAKKVITEYNNKDLFLHPNNICVYCKKEMRLLHASWDEEDEDDTDGHGTFYSATKFYLCQTCGWWHNLMFEDWDNFDYHRYTMKKVKGVLKIFSVEDYKIPLETLNDEIKKNPEILHSIHSKKMEEVVKFVFQNYYNCEIHHCGKSHDGVIDLIILENDNPIAIQVKRRMSSNYVEPVSIVREFLGAMTYSNNKKGIFVSTAEKFSSEAVKFSNGIISNRNIDQFDLINKNQFLDIFNFVKKDISNPFDRFKQWEFKNIVTNIDNPYNS